MQIERHKTISNFGKLLYVGLVILVGVTMGMVVYKFPENPIKLIPIAFGGIFLCVILYDLHIGLLALIFITYTGMSYVANKYFGVPQVSNILAAILLTGFAIRCLTGNGDFGFSVLFGFIIIYGIIGTASLVYAVDPDRVRASLILYFKGALLAVVIVAILREPYQLRAVFWTLMAAGTLLGVLNCHQYYTGQFENQYWGFCLSEFKDIVGKTKGFRIGGPIGLPNFFAQFLLVLLPISINRVWHERAIFLRILAGLAFIVISATIILTYSRGAFVSILIMLIVYLVFYPPKIKCIIVVLMFIAPMLAMTSSSYLERMKSLLDVVPGNNVEIRSDSSYKGRASEMLVAIDLFVENPLFGVGWGNYSVHYVEKADKFLLDLRQEARKAHCRYLEVLSESGIVGLTVYLTMLYVALNGLLRAQQIVSEHNLQNLEGMASTFGISLIGYLAAYLFLHGDFQRYFWILIGVAYAIPKIIYIELSKNS